MVDVVHRVAEEVHSVHPGGWGVRSVDDASAVAARRCRKGQRNTAAFERPELITEIRDGVRANVCRVRSMQRARATEPGLEVFSTWTHSEGADVVDWATEAVVAARVRSFFSLPCGGTTGRKKGRHRFPNADSMDATAPARRSRTTR